MTTSAGFDSQVGYALEGTSGTYQAPTRAIEHVKSTLALEVDRIISKGIKAGRRHQGRWFPGAQRVKGGVTHEMSAANMGLLFRPLMGAVSTTGTDPYTHVFTPGPKAETETLTIQVGKPDEAGTVQPMSYVGCHILGATITSKTGEASMIDLDIYGQHLDTTQSLVAAVYSADWAPFTFLHGALEIASSEYQMDAISLKMDNKLKTDRHVHRATNPARPRISKESGFREWGGDMDGDFFDLTMLNRFRNGTEAALSMVWSNGTDSITVAGNIRFDNNDPSIDGPDMVKQKVPFVFVSTTSDAAALTVTLVNGDSAP